MIRQFLLSLSTLLLLATVAQAQRKCGSMELLARQLKENPAMQQQIEDIERDIAAYSQTKVHERVIVTIPVVVNVVWNTSAENISDAQIQTQLDVLNADYRRLNSDAGSVPSVWQSIAADCEVNFCLAQQDPSGLPSTGIRRQQTATTSFSTNDNVKHTSTGGLDIWDRNKYLNLWVCDLGSGLLGYAQFPGGPAATDGVVIDYQAFGTIGSAAAPFNLGRTATHEVGHWLNLNHIWGDDGTSCSGTDNVADTPNQADENYGCPAFPSVSCSNGPNGDMWMNYMDYTDDACMYMFTAGQKTRMQAVLNGTRASLMTSPGCTPGSGGGGCGTPSGLAATSITQTGATLSWAAVSGATSYNLQWKLSTSSTWTTVAVSGTSYGLSGLAANTTYNYQAQAVCSGTSGAYSAASTFTTLASGGGGCADAYEANNTQTTAKVIPVNTTFTAQIANSTDKDWYKFSNTNATRNIKIDLTTLPFDYDVRLYRNSSYLAVSENANTTPEQIIYNTTTVSTAYYAYVYGYNGAYSNTQCYTLRVSLSASNWRNDGTTDGPVEELEIPVMFEQADFGLFPNPANEQVTVEIPLEADASNVAVTILDPSGKLALQQHRAISKGDNRFNFDVSNLPNGVYFVQVRNGKEVKSRKLVIEQ